jgi:hypothetical protein
MKETLEEVAKRLYGASYEAITREQRIMRTCKLESFRAGAKWQQENSYSEEEVYELFQKYISTQIPLARLRKILHREFKEWFEKNKKK